MRSLMEFLGELRAKGVTLTLDGESLKCAAAPGVLNSELKAELLRQKPEIIEFLRTSQKSFRAGEPVLSRIDRSGPLPLSYAQQRLWFLNQLDPDSTVYNIGTALQLTGPLNVRALERTLKEIIRRHENLRTYFLQVNGMPQTLICEEVQWSLNVIDVQHLAGEETKAELIGYASSLIREHLDIAHAPLFKADLLITGPESHLLILTLHHIIFDGWSVGVFSQELTELYRAYSVGRESELAPLPLQYVDYAAWQRKWLEAGELDRQLVYWKKQLAGAPPVIAFPPDHRRPSADQFRGTRSKLTLAQELTSALEAVSQRHGVTLFMVLLAAFKVLLARYTGQDDIVVGSPSANRTRTELYPMMGFFVNNLVLRTDLSGGLSFSEVLKRVREVTRRAYEHQDVPFDQLVQALRPERSLDHSPLFQTMFVFQNFRVEDLDLSGVEVKQVELEVDTARFDLTVEVFPRNGKLQAFFDYNTDLYDADTVSRLQKHYLAILEAVVANADVKISDIPLLSSSEQEKLLFEWNRTEAPIPVNICFHQQFEKHASTTPDRVAVMAGDTSITYGELERRANQIASALRAKGAGPEKLVAIFQERGIDLLAAILGVAKSGAAYVPLDPVYPKGRIEAILEDAQPVAILTSRPLLELLPACAERTLCLDELRAGALQSQDANVGDSAGVNQDNLAYVIFTSGSTGKPKGVQITHRALLNFLEAMQSGIGFSESDVLLAVTTVSFDIAALELLLPLYSGATACVCLQPGNPEGLLRDLDKYRPTVMQATPATWKLLIAAGWQGTFPMKVLCGGEAMEPALARSLLVRSKTLWNMYGPTETTIWSAALRVEDADQEGIPVGRPIQNTTFYVLDNAGQPVPQGVAGELWIGGEGLARGYLNRPDLTAERFQPCPFTEQAGAQMYRTGDLVRYRSDGTLDFYGRLDHQVKLRGFRIELGEIDNTLRNCEGILDAVTLLHEDDGEKRLVAYLKHAKGQPPSHFSIRDRLRESLPEYMVPATFVFLEEFPRLPNGKLDRSSLPSPERPSPERTAREADDHYLPPSNHVEVVMIEIWREVLGVDKISVLDNFFELGGHSLTAVRLISRLRSALGMDLPLRCIFIDPTIASLASHIYYDGATHGYRYTSETPRWNCLVPAQPRGTRTPLFFVGGYQSPDDTLLVLSQLIPNLGMDQPVFGFRPRWIEGNGDDYVSVEEMAHEFLAELRAVQPTGPYLLGGHCVGGIAALEVARLLLREGEEVRLMVFLDTDRPSPFRAFLTDLYFMRQRLRHIFEVLAGIIRPGDRARGHIIRDLLHRKLKIAPTLQTREMDRFYQAKVRYRRLLYTHISEKYPGRITLIVNESDARYSRGLGWTGIARDGLDVHVLPGDHTTILTEHGQEVARVILKCMDAALPQPDVQVLPTEVHA
jgi:amino acid adenylation domain-containing protein